MQWIGDEFVVKIVEQKNPSAFCLNVGNDALVLMGLHEALGRNAIQVLEFEYHKVGKWAEIRLSSMLDFLDHHAFDCFWQGNQGQLWQLSGCWDKSYHEDKQWSNVVCAHRKSAAYSKFVDQSKEHMI